MSVVSANDVAAYILASKGEMTAMKLQKLLYYAQAWSLVWDDQALFQEEIQAWINGPVIPDLYSKHKGTYLLKTWPNGDPEKLTPCQIETIDAVLMHYGDQSSQWLSDLTHQETPWIDARKGLPSDERGSSVISHAAMAEFYSELV